MVDVSHTTIWVVCKLRLQRLVLELDLPCHLTPRSAGNFGNAGTTAAGSSPAVMEARGIPGIPLQQWILNDSLGRCARSCCRCSTGVALLEVVWVWTQYSLVVSGTDQAVKTETVVLLHSLETLTAKAWDTDSWGDSWIRNYDISWVEGILGSWKTSDRPRRGYHWSGPRDMSQHSRQDLVVSLACLLWGVLPSLWDRFGGTALQWRVSSLRHMSRLLWQGLSNAEDSYRSEWWTKWTFTWFWLGGSEPLTESISCELVSLKERGLQLLIVIDIILGHHRVDI